VFPLQFCPKFRSPDHRNGREITVFSLQGTLFCYIESRRRETSYEELKQEG